MKTNRLALAYATMTTAALGLLSLHCGANGAGDDAQSSASADSFGADFSGKAEGAILLPYGEMCPANAPNGCFYWGGVENYPVGMACESGTLVVANSTYYVTGGGSEDCSGYVASACNGNEVCSPTYSNTACGGDPEYGVVKTSTAQVSCQQGVTGLGFGSVCPAGAFCEYAAASVDFQTVPMQCAPGSTMIVANTAYGIAPSALESCTPSIAAACTGKNACTITFDPTHCGGDPAYGVAKDGWVNVSCSDPGVQVPAGPFTSDSVLYQAGGIVVEQVGYLSDGLVIEAQICRPDDGAQHPVIMWNHGGFAGNATETFNPAAPTATLCANLALDGYVVGESSYRGEDQSQGNIEVCRGEVDDVMNLIADLRTEPYVDPTRVAEMGQSHGGCITQQVALRDPTIKAAVDLSGPTDWTELDDWWNANVQAGEPASFCNDGVNSPGDCAAAQQSLASQVQASTGGLPWQQPDAYEERSPMADLDRLTVPYLVFQGTDDFYVDMNQACEKMSALAGDNPAPLAWYLDPNLNVQGSNGMCPGLSFQGGAIPDVTNASAWLGSNVYLFLLQGQGHGFVGNAATLSQQISLAFLVSRL